MKHWVDPDSILHAIYWNASTFGWLNLFIYLKTKRAWLGQSAPYRRVTSRICSAQTNLRYYPSSFKDALLPIRPSLEDFLFFFCLEKIHARNFSFFILILGKWFRKWCWKWFENANDLLEKRFLEKSAWRGVTPLLRIPGCDGELKAYVVLLNAWKMHEECYMMFFQAFVLCNAMQGCMHMMMMLYAYAG